MDHAVLDDVVTWAPTEGSRDASRMQGFARWVADTRGIRTSGYRQLWEWSTHDPSAFWDAVREHFDVLGTGFTGPALAE